jgi:hypothetical protein
MDDSSRVDSFLALCERISGSDEGEGLQDPTTTHHTSPHRLHNRPTPAARKATPPSTSHSASHRPRTPSSEDLLPLRPPTLFRSNDDQYDDETPPHHTTSTDDDGSGGGGKRVVSVFEAPPPVLPRGGSRSAPAATAVEDKRESVFEALLEMFPGRHHRDLYAIAGTTPSLDDAIAAVIESQVGCVGRLPPCFRSRSRATHAS